MISKNNPKAWDYLLDVIAERVVNDVLNEQLTQKTTDSHQLLVHTSSNASRNIRPLQYR